MTYDAADDVYLGRLRHLVRLIGNFGGQAHVRMLGRVAIAWIQWPDGEVTVGTALLRSYNLQQYEAQWLALNEAYLRKVGGDGL